MLHRFFYIYIILFLSQHIYLDISSSNILDQYELTFLLIMCPWSMLLILNFEIFLSDYIIFHLFYTFINNHWSLFSLWGLIPWAVLIFLVHSPLSDFNFLPNFDCKTIYNPLSSLLIILKNTSPVWLLLSVLC